MRDVRGTVIWKSYVVRETDAGVGSVRITFYDIELGNGSVVKCGVPGHLRGSSYPQVGDVIGGKLSDYVISSDAVFFRGTGKDGPFTKSEIVRQRLDECRIVSKAPKGLFRRAADYLL